MTLREEVMSHPYIYTTLYTGCNQHAPYEKSYIEQLSVSHLVWAKDGNECYFVWGQGWPGPNTNTYNRSNYKREWGYSTEEHNGSIYLR